MRVLDREGRERAVRTWLESYRPKDYRRMKKAGTLDQVVKERAVQIDQEYGEAVNQVQNDLINEKIQGTEEGRKEYEMRLRQKYAAILHQYLPASEENSPEEE